MPFCVCGGDSTAVVKVDPDSAFVYGCRETITDACEMAKLCNCPNSKEEDYCHSGKIYKNDKYIFLETIHCDFQNGLQNFCILYTF